MSQICRDARADLLPLRVAGTIDEADLAALDAHLRTCGDCRIRLAHLEWMSAMGRRAGPELYADHVRPEELVAYVSRSTTLPEAAAAEIGRHIAACPLCAEEFGILHAVDHDLRQAAARESASAPSRRGGWLRRLWPTGGGFSPAWVAAVLLLIPAAVGIRSWMGNDAPPEQATPARVIAPRLLQPSTDRAQAALPEIAIPPSGTVPVLLATSLAPTPRTRYAITLFAPDGREVWSEPDLGASGELATFVVTLPASRLGSGIHRIELEERLADTDSVLTALTYRFVAARGPGPR